MKLNTKELVGEALDRAVAVACGCKPRFVRYGRLTYWNQEAPPSIEFGTVPDNDRISDEDWRYEFRPSERWDQAGPILEREQIMLMNPGTASDKEWYALVNAWYDYDWPRAARDDWAAYGATPLVAAMRAFVASKLGNEVEIP